MRPFFASHAGDDVIDDADGAKHTFRNSYSSRYVNELPLLLL
jgi:hypothetical protein